jgi:hypothetical protein
MGRFRVSDGQGGGEVTRKIMCMVILSMRMCTLLFPVMGV